MGVTHYIWDELSDNVLMETDETGAVTAQYIQEPDLYGSVVSQNRGGTDSFYHFDGQGSTRQLTDASGTVTDEATYSAFGTEVANSGATVNPWGYKGAMGYYANPGPNDLYVRGGELSPSLGRWFNPRQLSAYYLAAYAFTQIGPAKKNAFVGRTAIDLDPRVEPSCQCGTYRIRWRIQPKGQGLTDVANDGIYLVVQKVCVIEQAKGCKWDCGCSEDGRPLITRKFCIIEKLGEGNVFMGAHPTDDHESAIGVGLGDPNAVTCRLHGRSETSAEIRLVTTAVERAWVEARGWLPAGSIQGVDVGEHIVGVPAWWNGPRAWYYAVGFTDDYVRWNCCPAVDRNAGEMILQSSSGFYRKSMCEPERLPPIESAADGDGAAASIEEE